MHPHSLLMDPIGQNALNRVDDSAAQAEDARSRALLARFAKGEEAAFTTLITEHQDTVFAYARRILGDGDLARDVAQEAFLRVLRHHRKLDAGRSFRAWLLHITRNLAIDVLRRRRTQAAQPYEEWLTEAIAARPEADLERQETRVRIHQVLADLPGKYREILIMREMDGMPAEEIATVIGVDYGTTRWRLHKSRTLFREAWLARFGDAP